MKDKRGKMMSRFFLVLAVCSVLIIPKMALADNYARDYTTAPPGTFGAIIYNFYITAEDMYANGHKVAKNLDFEYDLRLFRFIYFFEKWGWLHEPEALFFHGNASLDNNMPYPDRMELSTTGMGDPTFLWVLYPPGYWGQNNLWLFIAPIWFTVPTGNYDNKGALSIGGNRWVFRQEEGFVKAWEMCNGHKLYWDLTLAQQEYCDNDDLGQYHQTLSQDPEFNVETHLSYDITKAFALAGDYYYHWGGETEIDGVDQNNKLSTHSVGMTGEWWILPNVQLLIQYRQDVGVRNGLKTKQFNMRFFYAFDLPSVLNGGGKK